MRIDRRRSIPVAAMLLGAVTIPSPVLAQQPDSLSHPAACTDCIRGPLPGSDPVTSAAPQDTTRHRAIEYSDAYYTRLTIHRIGSYVELPLFAAEYYLGNKLLTEENNGTFPRQSSLATVHGTVAGGLGVLFAVNTVTGVWNLIESRHTAQGRARRWIHSLSMLAADGGFFWAESVAGDAKKSDAGAARHRNIALGSISIATASTVMMWLWKK